MPLELGTEVAQAGPTRSGVEVYLSDRNRAPILGESDSAAGMVPDCGEHPVAGDILIGTAYEVSVILGGARFGELGIAAPDRPGDHLGAALGELPRDFREKAVVADHHAEGAEAGLED